MEPYAGDSQGVGLRLSVGYASVWATPHCGLRLGVGYASVWAKPRAREAYSSPPAPNCANVTRFPPGSRTAISSAP